MPKSVVSFKRVDLIIKLESNVLTTWANDKLIDTICVDVGLCEKSGHVVDFVSVFLQFITELLAKLQVNLIVLHFLATSAPVAFKELLPAFRCTFFLDCLERVFNANNNTFESLDGTISRKD